MSILDQAKLEKKLVLAIDQGTTGTTVCLMTEEGELFGKTTVEFPQIYPEPGWVEHNPEDIWSSVETAVRQSLKISEIKVEQIVAIGITNQRETAIIWEKKNSLPIYNAIVWQCRRTADFCENLHSEKKAPQIKRKTGLVIDPYFSASKFRWLLKNVSGAKVKAKKGEVLAGTIDAFLLWKLTNGETHRTDVSNASRTMLMNIETGQWDEWLLNLFEIPEEILPKISPSSGVLGYTKGLSFLPDGIPIAGIAGDQQAALFGQACFEAGQAKCTYGTGSFLLMNTGKKMLSSQNGLLTTVAWQLSGDKKMTYALEGGAFICGAAVQWLRDGLGIITKSSEIEELANQVSETGGVEFVPALTGLGAPYWDSEARGIICGLTRGSNKYHLARATLEGMALQNTEILLAMQKDLGRKITRVKVDGGASTNTLLMQMQADYLGVNITRPLYIETTAAGAGFLAGLGVGLWKNLDAIEKIWKIDRTFEGKLSLPAREKRLEYWRLAIKRARH